METVIINATEITAGINIIIGGSEVCPVIAAFMTEFSEAERDYQFGEKKESEPFVSAKKIVITATDGNGSPVTIFFSSTDNVAVAVGL
ncbi:hypothetical protein ACBC55_09490 [Klebsiella spallanzanii]